MDRAKGKAIVVTVKGIPDDGIPDSVRTKQSKRLSTLLTKVIPFTNNFAVSAANIFTNDVGRYIWRDFLPVALEKGLVVPKPDPVIIGQELRCVQAGLDAQKKGVSAKKVVITGIA